MAVDKRILLYVGLNILVLVAACIYGQLYIDGIPVFNHEGFVERSKNSLLGLSFFTSPRPFTVDLLYKLWGSEPEQIVIGQQCLLTLSWVILSIAIGSLLHSFALRLISAILFPCFMFWWNIFGWTFVMRSEAVSFSLFALWLATLLFFIQKPQKLPLGLLIITTFFFSFTRDNLPYALLAGTVLLLSILRKYHRSYYKKNGVLLKVLLLSMLLIFALQTLSAHLGKRHDFCLINVLLQRILVNDDYTRWFIDRGMPVDSTILQWQGKWASSDDFRLYRDPRYAHFMNWVSVKGQFTYGLFLLTHPLYTLQPLVQDLAPMFSYNLDLYTHKPPQRAFIRTLHMLLPFSSVLTALCSALLAVLVFTKTARTEALLLAVLVATVFFNALFIYHADAMEVPRHSIMNMIALECLTYTGFLLLADFLLGRAQECRPS
jgi:hypothetical protein